MSLGKNWDEDAEEDGIIVYPELKDSREETVEFEGIELKVDIEIWTLKWDTETFKQVTDRLVYSPLNNFNYILSG